MCHVVRLICCQAICSNLELFLALALFYYLQASYFAYLFMWTIIIVIIIYFYFFCTKARIILLIGVPSIVVMQDYIKESDNLVSLHDQIRDCDSILSQMETLLSGFQVC